MDSEPSSRNPQTEKLFLWASFILFCTVLAFTWSTYGDEVARLEGLRASEHPEFDAWRWNEYWVPLDVVIEFKRGVYEMALTELARFLPRSGHHNRYLRAGMRGVARVEIGRRTLAERALEPLRAARERMR